MQESFAVVAEAKDCFRSDNGRRPAARESYSSAVPWAISISRTGDVRHPLRQSMRGVFDHRYEPVRQGRNVAGAA